MTRCQSWRWPSHLKMVTWSELGVKSNLAWADLFTKTTGCQVQLEIEPDVVSRFKQTGNGRYDLLAGFTNETSQMLLAERGFAAADAGPFPVRIVWSYSRSNSGFFTGADSGIKSPLDIKPGTRITEVSSFLPNMRLFKALLAWAQVDEVDIDWVSVGSAPEMADAVSSGRADIGFAIPTSATAQRAEAGGDISWVDLNAELDSEGAARFNALYPLINFGTVSAESGAVASAAGHWCTEGINYFVTRAGTDDELVYRLAQWFDEHFEQFRERHPDNRSRSREVLLRGLEHTFIPCHPGLVRMLRESGGWSETLENRQRENTTLVSGYVDAYREALEKAGRAGIIISPDSKDWTQLWNGLRQEKNLPPVRLYAGLTGG